MPAAMKHRVGFAGRPLALRRCLIEILDRRDRLTAAEMASIAYRRHGGRLVVDPAHRLEASLAQVTATRRALRRLIERGRVRVIGRYRRHRIFALAERQP